MSEEHVKRLAPEEHAAWRNERLFEQIPKILANDAVLVVNLEKQGLPNYIGGATFSEMFFAHYTGRSSCQIPFQKRISSLMR
ncbi:MAG: hypothetical protein ACE5DM_04285 [Candidatus Nanoarchaeia archaeon]